LAGTDLEYAVLCGPEDGSALWAAGRLRDRGVPLRVVTVEELVYAPSIRYATVGTGVVTEVRLGDGTVLGPNLRGTLNRVSRLPSAHLEATASTERDYMLQELHAVLVSLLHAWPGVVVGRADPRGLCGAWWRPAEWMVAAGQSGLVGVGYRSGGSDDVPSSRTVLVVAGEVVPPSGVEVPEAVVAGSRTLAARHGGGLLGLDFAVEGDAWVFQGGTPWPDLRAGGPAVVDALHSALSAREPVPA
jgi:hypothetical protein